jgi:hypothetical protein
MRSANSKKEQPSTLTEADKRLIDFLIKQAIKQAVNSCS